MEQLSKEPPQKCCILSDFDASLALLEETKMQEEFLSFLILSSKLQEGT
jgi:hypothetical protein